MRQQETFVVRGTMVRAGFICVEAMLRGQGLLHATDALSLRGSIAVQA